MRWHSTIIFIVIAAGRAKKVVDAALLLLLQNSVKGRGKHKADESRPNKTKWRANGALMDAEVGRTPDSNDEHPDVHRIPSSFTLTKKN